LIIWNQFMGEGGLRDGGFRVPNPLEMVGRFCNVVLTCCAEPRPVVPSIKNVCEVNASNSEPEILYGFLPRNFSDACWSSNSPKTYTMRGSSSSRK